MYQASKNEKSSPDSRGNDEDSLSLKSRPTAIMIHPERSNLHFCDGSEGLSRFCKVRDSIALIKFECNNGIDDEKYGKQSKLPALTDETRLWQTHHSAGPLGSSKNTTRRSVRFSDVTVREYGMVIGDHPCCSYGPPVTLGWDYEENEAVSLDDFECKRRRTLRQMILSYYRRKDLLQLAGASREEIKQATKFANRTKRQRSMTRSLLITQPIETGLESTCRKLKRLLKEDHWRTEAHLFK
mmetsp:Transcript_54940/g.81771  ORF Transcript_54940/g.81771 Transcript_54940/m.81771 type:complete len:241 (+) Transcript_54940:137-859(+)